MCRSVAQEWGQHGIRVNTISPGYIRTAMTDELLAAEPALEKTWMAGALLGRLGAPEDFKAPTVFLLADGSSWMTGADLRYLSLLSLAIFNCLLPNVGLMGVIVLLHNILPACGFESHVEHEYAGPDYRASFIDFQREEGLWILPGVSRIRFL